MPFAVLASPEGDRQEGLKTDRGGCRGGGQAQEGLPPRAGQPGEGVAVGQGPTCASATPMGQCLESEGTVLGGSAYLFRSGPGSTQRWCEAFR